MKKMKIEKQLIFADHVKRIVSLQVQENLTYRHEDEGIRAMGPLYIKGEYEGAERIEKFQETLEMDVLAPKDKCNGNEFRLDIADYQGKAQDDSIQVMITLDIYGLKEDTQKKAEMSPRKDASDKIEQKEDGKETDIPTTVEEIKDDEAQDNPQASVKEFEDLFPDAESTYTSYRMIVAKPNDTYTAIAQRYGVDENALRDTNRNKEILAKTLVILPYEQK